MSMVMVGDDRPHHRDGQQHHQQGIEGSSASAHKYLSS